MCGFGAAVLPGEQGRRRGGGTGKRRPSKLNARQSHKPHGDSGVWVKCRIFQSLAKGLWLSPLWTWVRDEPLHPAWKGEEFQMFHT